MAGRTKGRQKNTTTKKKVPPRLLCCVKNVIKMKCCVVVCVCCFFFFFFFFFSIFFCFFGERRDERVSFVILSFLVLLPVLRVCSSAGVEEEPFLNLPLHEEEEEEEEKKRVRSSCRLVFLLDERLCPAALTNASL